MIRLFLDIDPSVKRRPRFKRAGANVVTYSDPKDVLFKKSLIALARTQIDHPLKGPLRCDIIFFIKRPKSVKDKYPTGKRTGDIDNLAKAVLDALNPCTKEGFNGAYDDDSQIISLTCSKNYRDISGIEVSIYGLN